MLVQLKNYRWIGVLNYDRVAAPTPLFCDALRLCEAGDNGCLTIETTEPITPDLDNA
ncbi:hypothetical protein [Chamaesiphon minutus]|uniref:hypothetical protein n=1 Tax=Chamaesiphon minutus TaxID=1173032 RepID=UPI0002E33AC4|nr:hypothetical protein [Chamaesiphon minutus]